MTDTEKGLTGSATSFIGWITVQEIGFINAWLQMLLLLVALVPGVYGLYKIFFKREKPE